MKCRDLARLIAQDDLVEAGWVDRLRVRLHLLMCKHCSRYVAQLREIGKAVRSAGTTPDPAGEAKAVRRIEQRLIERLPPGGSQPPSSSSDSASEADEKPAVE